MDFILYGSLHGAAKRYAGHLAEMTGIKAFDYKDVKDLSQYDRVIYPGTIDYTRQELIQEGIPETSHFVPLLTVTLRLSPSVKKDNSVVLTPNDTEISSSWKLVQEIIAFTPIMIKGMQKKNYMAIRINN